MVAATGSETPWHQAPLELGRPIGGSVFAPSQEPSLQKHLRHSSVAVPAPGSRDNRQSKRILCFGYGHLVGGPSLGSFGLVHYPDLSHSSSGNEMRCHDVLE